MATRDWWIQTDGPPVGSERLLLTCQKFIAIFVNAFLIVPVALYLIVRPDRVGRGTFVAGELNGWLAVLLTIAVVIAFAKVFKKSLSVASFLYVLAIGHFGLLAWRASGQMGWGQVVLLGSYLDGCLAGRICPGFATTSPNRSPARKFLGLTFDTIGGTACWCYGRMRDRRAGSARGPFLDPLAPGTIGALVARVRRGSSIGLAVACVSLRGGSLVQCFSGGLVD
jgi:hypothetical protein